MPLGGGRWDRQRRKKAPRDFLPWVGYIEVSGLGCVEALQFCPILASPARRYKLDIFCQRLFHSVSASGTMTQVGSRIGFIFKYSAVKQGGKVGI